MTGRGTSVVHVSGFYPPHLGGAEVTDGYDGLLVPPGDAGALSEARLSVLADRGPARRPGRAGPRTAVSRFARSERVPGYLDLFRELLGRSSARPAGAGQ